ncbi:MAG TPA: NADH-quinone oxidoreductase subunit NuoK [Planctomycetaceae bacterium]|jgi:NADH-quinone oxidoreductase subunit K|nr:NADH-quinone oxidoreductase subunit NuoK [Planctomycetaceae bacterium]
MSSELFSYLIVGSVLFALGALGFLTRRNVIVAFLSAEMMLLGVTLNLVAFSYEHSNYEGQAFTAFVLTVAACEAGLALALISALYRMRRTLDLGAWHDLGEPDAEERFEPPELESPQPVPHFPRLTPAGNVPQTAPLPNPAEKKVLQETPSHV